MLEAMTRKWWVLLVRGLFGMLIGVLAFTRPGLTVLSIVIAWAVFAEADGIAALVLAMTGHHPPRSRWALMVAGVVGIVAGLVTLAFPASGVIVLLWIVAAWAIGRGAFQVIAALELRRFVEGEWLMIASGMLSVIFGVAVIAEPIFGVRTLAYLVGLYASAVGLLEVALSFRVRQFGLALERRVAPRPSAV